VIKWKSEVLFMDGARCFSSRCGKWIKIRRLGRVLILVMGVFLLIGGNLGHRMWVKRLDND